MTKASRYGSLARSAWRSFGQRYLKTFASPLWRREHVRYPQGNPDLRDPTHRCGFSRASLDFGCTRTRTGTRPPRSLRTHPGFISTTGRRTDICVNAWRREPGELVSSVYAARTVPLGPRSSSARLLLDRFRDSRADGRPSGLRRPFPPVASADDRGGRTDRGGAHSMRSPFSYHKSFSPSRSARYTLGPISEGPSARVRSCRPSFGNLKALAPRL